jgi:tRNA threonylcarbamoyl adenosine modification protein YeaZ
MSYSLVLHCTYTHIEVALYRDTMQHVLVSIPKFDATKKLVSTLNDIITAHNLSLADVALMIVNQGPAPFTTLRTSITTANALHFATGIPLTGINGLEALIAEQATPEWTHTVALLNAFGRDVYYGVQKAGAITHLGCASIDQLLCELATQNTHDPIRFIGNGVLLYEKNIREIMKDRAHIPVQLPEICSLDAIAQVGFEQYESNGTTADYLEPLYLKQSYSPQK